MLKTEVCPNHVHMYIEILSKIIISNFMTYLKIRCGRSNFMSEKYRNSTFYYVDTAVKNVYNI